MILIDPPRWPAHGQLFAHLVSDESFAELHAFAARVGLPARAFDYDHYDVVAQRCDELLAAGAAPVSTRELLTRLTAAGLRRPRRDRITARSPAISAQPRESAVPGVTAVPGVRGSAQ